jgi:hypothetical protein
MGGETVTRAIARRMIETPPAWSAERMRMITVGRASQNGTLCASTSPLNAIVARRTELRAKA